ncbi:hypothetical protein RF11_00684 [Thelohanellus kitauei]|uniref:Uncharacterized protein n=1 Tax=Thelohanellus kitauei TaxID=669202 RepID=A0A0C2N7Q0_THEKT|nr:hypothetical protein RF11_00684 [Thelohanellus kitauei]
MRELISTCEDILSRLLGWKSKKIESVPDPVKIYFVITVVRILVDQRIDFNFVEKIFKYYIDTTTKFQANLQILFNICKQSNEYKASRRFDLPNEPKKSWMA